MANSSRRSAPLGVGAGSAVRECWPEFPAAARLAGMVGCRRLCRQSTPEAVSCAPLAAASA